MEKKNAGYRRPMGWMTERNAATTIVTPGGKRVYKNIHPEPKKVEVTAAVLLADYFGMDAQMLSTAEYKTPDVKIGREVWEIKSLKKGKRETIRHALERAKGQARTVVIDARYLSKIPRDAIRRRIVFEWQNIPQIRRILMIDAKSNVFEILKNSGKIVSKNRQ